MSEIDEINLFNQLLAKAVSEDNGDNEDTVEDICFITNENNYLKPIKP